jgi:hypothetical protein
MKKYMFFLPLFSVFVSVPIFSATLQNTDQRAYELEIQEPGPSYSHRYRIIENSQIEICFYGCEITMLSTGQTVTVNPKDTVVIDSGVMSVTPGD